MRGSHSPPNSSLPAFPWRQPPPPAPALTDAPGLTPGPRFNPNVGHDHLYRPQPFPGAPAFAYQSLGLVEFSPIGPAVVNRMQFNVLPSPPLFAQLGLQTHGLGGLVMGQLVSQPLVTPTIYQVEDYGLVDSGLSPLPEYGP